jgi:hypothetical protein
MTCNNKIFCIQRAEIKIFTVLIFSFFNSVFAQDSAKSNKIRNVIWTTPVKKNTVINGVAIGMYAIPWMKAESLKINGLNIEAAPLSFFGGIYALIGTIFSPFHFNKKDSTNNDGGDLGRSKIFTDSIDNITTKIKGVSLSLGGSLRGTQLSGISINGIVCFAERVKGFEIISIRH